MQEDHVPAIGSRYWAVLLVASIFGGSLCDIVTTRLALGFRTDMVLLAGALSAVFVAERYSRSTTDIWYWLAVIVIQAASTRLADFATIDLALGRFWVIPILAVLLVMTFLVARSSTMFVVSVHMISRPRARAKPMTDAAHWIAMVVASTLGTVISDFWTLGLGDSALLATLIQSALLVAVFGLLRLVTMNRLAGYWLTVTVIRAVGTAIGDLLTEGSHLLVGLPVGTALTGMTMIALLLLWPQPRPRS